jgi:hypothetical protein
LLSILFALVEEIGDPRRAKCSSDALDRLGKPETAM